MNIEDVRENIIENTCFGDKEKGINYVKKFTD